MVVLTREFFKDSIEECKESIICEIPYSKSNPITEIASKAFYDWEKIKYIVIPPSVLKVAEDAFLWNNIQLIISDCHIPNQYTGNILSYSNSNVFMVNILKKINDLNNKVGLNLEDILNKRDKINREINRTIVDLNKEENDLKRNYEEIKSLYTQLQKLLKEDKSLTQEQLDKIEQEVKRRIKKTLQQLESHEQTLIEKENEWNQKAENQKKQLEKQYQNIVKKVEELAKNSQQSLETVKTESEKVLQNLEENSKNLTEKIVEQAVEQIVQKNPYKNITIFLNNQIISKQEKQLVHKQFEKVVKILSLKLHPLLVGPAGCGKNVILEQASKTLGLDFYYVNDVTEEYKVMGFVDANGTFQQTQFFKAFTKGGLMMIDELDNSHPSALLAINAAIGTGYNQYLSFPDGNLYPCHESFYLAAAANTFGMGSDMIYCGRNALDGASLNRFIPVFIDYDKDLEENLVSDPSILPLYWEIRDSIQKNKIRHVISTRNIVNADKMKASNMFNKGEIFDATIIQGLSDEDLRMIINDLESNPGIDSVKKEFLLHLSKTRNVDYHEYRRVV